MGTDYYAKLVCGVLCRDYLKDRLEDNYSIQVETDGIPAFDGKGKPILRKVGRRVFNFTDKTTLPIEDFFEIWEKTEEIEEKFGIQIIMSGCENWVRPNDMIGIYLNDEYPNKEDRELGEITKDVIENGVTVGNFKRIIDFTHQRLLKIGIKEIPHIGVILHISY